MSMIAGSVTIAADQAETKSGLAGVVYDQLKVEHADDLAAVEQPFDDALAQLPPVHIEQMLLQGKADAVLAFLRGLAKTANAVGKTVGYIQSNAVVSLSGVQATVATSTSVGRLPLSTTPGSPIDGPGTAVGLPVTGAGGATTLGVG